MPEAPIPRPVFHLPARDIPVPSSVSPEAQAVLAMGPVGPVQDWPAPDDLEAWRARVAGEAEQWATFMKAAAKSAATVTREIGVGGCTVHEILPDEVAPDDRHVYLDIHGGAWAFGGGEICRALALMTAPATGARVWAVDYRMPPDHPYPVPLDDCLAAYRALLDERQPGEIVVAGASAGGNLAAALILRARDEGLPLPAAVVLNTPATDLTASGDTWQTNLGLDTVLTASATPAMLLYAGGHDLRDPYVSPLFGDLKGFPPTILLTGTRDLLLSDTVRMHRALRAAGVPAELHVVEAAGHGRFIGRAPEDRDIEREIRRFTSEHWAGPS
jgi:acetyl esterase/lipase